ncbi:MAG: T9SS type A sorting domain-containing protein [Cytophagaceae bacterium]|nr:T9SS type A sorting domain-containing protein [Cytophagaceae bacterium]MDW8455410.1 T9SS type A sorting domain-containing protein [Cytophagaceae bacterium]
MKSKYLFATALLYSCMISSHAQDTIKLVTYNLLRFEQSSCASDRTPLLRTILQYAKPDILVVNELENAADADVVLNDCLNQNGITYYQRATFGTNPPGYTDLNNLIYFNSNKFGLLSQFEIVTGQRDINKYVLYHKSPNLHIHQDTIKLTIYAVHLKAGSNDSDVSDRKKQADSLRKHVDAQGPGKFNIAAGDFNFKTATEPGFARLCFEGAYPFKDPVNMITKWNNNPSVAYQHTQSAQLNSSELSCTIGGGLDDRFDLILMSENILSGGNRVQYARNSYRPIGNDGKHLNKAINDGPNTSVPADVLAALHGMSDHLPVQSKLVLYYNPLVPPAYSVDGVHENFITEKAFSIYPNPANSYITIISKNIIRANLSIKDVFGSTLHTAEFSGDEESVDISRLSQGVYFIHITTDNQTEVIKIIKE